ncbi:MAG: tRNA glutamyl-Q(34) synthetase GluQRS [Pseudomonadota bacterium]|nr:tRNA glutamyl-Q(34) synthetase GluQRS [Pseudomonadota bacterium]
MALHQEPRLYRGRFAPSPTGPLHAGSLVAAFCSWLLARHASGKWLIRVEDIDPPREIAGATARQLATLDAFGLQPDEPVLRQRDRSDLYRTALDGLLASGDAFACHCSRSDLAETHGIHRSCVATATTRLDPAVRLRVPDDCLIAFDDAIRGHQQQDLAREVGDFVLRRADGLWAYQLAVVVDDAAQGITDIVRGADLLDSTPRQILLQRSLGLPTPQYAHLPLIKDAHGNKLGKSQDASAIDAGDPLPTLRMAWAALGQRASALRAIHDREALLQAAIAAFELSSVPRHDIDFAALHNTLETTAALELKRAPHPRRPKGRTP